MFPFLLRHILKDAPDPQEPHARAAIGSLSGWIGILCNALLFLGKLWISILSGSVSIAADAVNNLTDAFSSVVTLIGFRIADKPADANHPFGHARAEYVSGLGIAAMILFIGFELAKSSVEKILHPASVSLSLLSAAVLLCSIGAKLWLYLFNRYLGKTIRSSTLLGAAEDSRNDCVVTGAVLLSAVTESIWNIRTDGIIGLGISAFVLMGGLKLARDTVSSLLGEGPDPQLRSQIIQQLRQMPKVLGYHDLMIHDYGPGQCYATVHVEMDHKEDPLECHALIDDLEWECLSRYNVHLLVHYDPIIADDPEVLRLQQHIKMLLAERDPRLSLHDFRMIQGKRHMNLIFHVPLPEDLKGQEEALRRYIQNNLTEEDGRQYHVSITYDSTAFNL